MDLDLPLPDPRPDPARTAAWFILVGVVALVFAAAVTAALPKADPGGMSLAVKQVSAP